MSTSISYLDETWNGTFVKRFWAKVQIKERDDCWPWTGATMGYGYGHISKNGRSHGHEVAHRAMWKIKFGPIPEGFQVLHKCDNPICVNPSHLFLGTTKDNIQDCLKKNRHRHGQLPGETNPNVKLNQKQVLEIRERYSKGGVYQYELAKEYMVTSSQVSSIIRRESWSHI
jgi:hypothetical protein